MIISSLFNTPLFMVCADDCEYVLQKRNELLKDINKEMQSTAIVEGTTTIKSKKQLSQIVDTTLLKCYLQVSPTGAKGYLINLKVLLI